MSDCHFHLGKRVCNGPDGISALKVKAVGDGDVHAARDGVDLATIPYKRQHISGAHRLRPSSCVVLLGDCGQC